MKKFLRYPLRLLGLVTVVSIYFVSSLFVRDPSRKFKTLSFFSGIALRVLGIRVVADPEIEQLRSEASIVVSNHHSYLDIPLIASLVPSQFISTVEARRMPIFGFLIDRMGCLIIDRSSRTSRSREIAAMSEALRAGSTVTFFPEAQSTPGDELLHFFPRFFEPVHAIQGNALCLSIEWVSIGREKIHVGNRERILWFRQNSLFRHLLGLCANDRVEIRVRGSLVESARFPDAKTFSRACRETVLSNWKPITNAVRVRRVGLRVGRYVEPAEAIRRRE